MTELLILNADVVSISAELEDAFFMAFGSQPVHLLRIDLLRHVAETKIPVFESSILTI